MTLITSSEAQTIALGRKLGAKLKGYDVVVLKGDLGAGKTTLTKGIAVGMGYKGRVMSPTFGLAREYRTRRWAVYHLDLYRVAAKETGDIGLEEFLSDPRGVCVIEWPQAAEAYLPEDRLDLTLTPRRDGARSIRIKGTGRRSKELARALS